MGAGVIPFSVKDGDVLFLFHRTFTGRRAGCLVDFGGGAAPGEDHRQTAMREFIEETGAMFLADDPATVVPGRRQVEVQLPILRTLFDHTLENHPDWWCARADTRRGKPRDWKTFFVEFEYRDVSAMNRAWAADDGRRFVKRRELLWVPAALLSSYYSDCPERLWKRVRELRGATDLIHSIQASMQARQAALT